MQVKGLCQSDLLRGPDTTYGADGDFLGSFDETGVQDSSSFSPQVSEVCLRKPTDYFILKVDNKRCDVIHVPNRLSHGIVTSDPQYYYFVLIFIIT